MALAASDWRHLMKRAARKHGGSAFRSPVGLMAKLAKYQIATFIAIVAGLTHGSALTANLAVKGITNRLNQESKNARKPRLDHGFLAKSNTCPAQITAMRKSLPNSSRLTIYPDASKPSCLTLMAFAFTRQVEAPISKSHRRCSARLSACLRLSDMFDIFRCGSSRKKAGHLGV